MSKNSEIFRKSVTTNFLESLENCINAQKHTTMDEKLALVEKFQETGGIPTEVEKCVRETNIKPIYSDEGGHKYLKIPLSELGELGLIEDITSYSFMDWDDKGSDDVPVYLESDVDANSYIDRLEARSIPVNIVDFGEIKRESLEKLWRYSKDTGYYFKHYERDFGDLLDIHKASKSEDEKRAIISIIEDRFGAEKAKIKNSD